MLAHDPHLWAVVVAAGEGVRLAPLTRALYGEPVPKQFAVLDGERSLLQATVERALDLVPQERIVAIVSREREWMARQQLADWPRLHVIVQPRNLDTGPGALLPLAQIRALDPDARVVLLPADHHISNRSVLASRIQVAVDAARRSAKRLHLIGVVPDAPESEYGWIVPASTPSVRGLRKVKRFVEKPGPLLARELLAQGALWNTMVTVGDIEAFWELGLRWLPQHTACLDSWSRTAPGPIAASRLEAIYSSLPAANFSRALLERAHNLGVVAMEGSGWCDLGSTRRVFQALRGAPALDDLRARLRARRRAIAQVAIAG
jgi:mannose-1-phosphate guanylyltransferase